MAARQQVRLRCLSIESAATDSKAGNETHVGLDMETTQNDWDRLGELLKSGVTLSFVTIVPMVTIDQRAVGSKGNYHTNKGKLKMASKEFEKVMYFVGMELVEDIGLVKCLSVLYDVPNPFLWTPALDGFELPTKRTCGFNSEESAVFKCQGLTIQKVESRNLTMMHIDPSAGISSKTTEERLTAAVKLVEAIGKPDFGKKVKERNKAKATEKFNSIKKTINTDKSNVKLISTAAEIPDSRKKAKTTEVPDSRKKAKTTEVSDSRKKAKTTKVYDSRKRTEAREISSVKHELKATEESTSPGKELMFDEFEAGKGTDNQEKVSSRPRRPDRKSVRTCMTCGLQEPAPKVFKKCRRCKDEGYPDPPYYCGRDCQVLDWTARHRQQHEKNYIQEIQPSRSSASLKPAVVKTLFSLMI